MSLRVVRPVICVPAGCWDFQHPLDLTQSKLEAKFALEGSVDYELPDKLSPDIRLCRTQWPGNPCACRAYILEWHLKDRRN